MPLKSTRGNRVASSALGRRRSDGCAPYASRMHSHATNGRGLDPKRISAVWMVRVRGDTTTTSGANVWNR